MYLSRYANLRWAYCKYSSAAQLSSTQPADILGRACSEPASSILEFPPDGFVSESETPWDGSGYQEWLSPRGPATEIPTAVMHSGLCVIHRPAKVPGIEVGPASGYLRPEIHEQTAGPNGQAKRHGSRIYIYYYPDDADDDPSPARLSGIPFVDRDPNNSGACVDDEGIPVVSLTSAIWVAY
ncbi:hypothetical protein BO70DRAFT_356974 [Aspergillus heteromorphus CBS 117.55]|uniref:Uncharacterized protein n=1 Tax=Aspergillus heteromorphus CBS 117.55 TaxID=1448321 RepID=A0A317URP2_9EURO|nr:uncharacterized protein BO70DRAFT_356974 [Aspergillus heteromorphus CBS 117.55]PWY64305.1 hypothetical protein BO70DRAFT_356974 [Aspergillus heteromorphus CBS 117.55]